MTTTLDPTPGVLESPRTMLRGAARGGLANLAGAGFTGAAGLAVTWLVARALSPVAAGAFFSATATFVLAAAVAKLGTQTSMVYWPARLRATGDPDGLARCLRVGLAPVALASTGLAAAVWLAAALFSTDSAYSAQLRALVLFLPAAALTDAILAATRGFRVMRPTVVLDRIVRPAAQLVLVAAFWLTGTSPESFATAWAAPYTLVAILAWYALTTLRRSCSYGRDKPAEIGATRAPHLQDRRRFSEREYWAFTAPRAVASAAQMALQRVDVLLVAALAGLAPAALYAVAARFMILGQFINQGLSQSVQPRLAERLAVGDTAGANVLYRQATAWLILLTWPMYFLVITYAPVYLGLFGPGYAQGTPIVTVLAATMLVATACGMVDMVLAMGGRTWWNLANVCLALAVMLAFDAVLVPRHGALGAAIGLSAAVLTNNLVPLAQVIRGLGLHPFGRATLYSAALATGCFAVPQMLLLPTEGAWPRVAATATGVAAYVYGAVRLKTTLMQGGR